MNYLKITLSTFAIFTIGYLTIVWFEKEIVLNDLRLSKNITEAKIVRLVCANRDYITFELNGKEISQRIYLSDNECNQLKRRTHIRLKVGSNNNIIFANDNYNDPPEEWAILLLGGFLVVSIGYYGIIKDMLK